MGLRNLMVALLDRIIGVGLYSQEVQGRASRGLRHNRPSTLGCRCGASMACGDYVATVPEGTTN